MSIGFCTILWRIKLAQSLRLHSARSLSRALPFVEWLDTILRQKVFQRQINPFRNQKKSEKSWQRRNQNKSSNLRHFNLYRKIKLRFIVVWFALDSFFFDFSFRLSRKIISVMFNNDISIKKVMSGMSCSLDCLIDFVLCCLRLVEFDLLCKSLYLELEFDSRWWWWCSVVEFTNSHEQRK